MTATRRDRRGAAYWDDSASNPLAIGCSLCPDLQLCGGLHTSSGAFNCLTFCCNDPERCGAVCPKSSSFIERVHEVEGFDLLQLKRAPIHPVRELPDLVPLIYAKGRRTGRFFPKAAALPLFDLVDYRTGALRFRDPRALRDAYGIDPRTPLVLSGTGEDKRVERWWQLGDRSEVLRSLEELRIALVTTPNYSVFSDQPRHDDFHSMKRIGIVFGEIASAGIPTALHVNGRTERDFDRWSEFVQARPEVTHIAFEFGTGAGFGRRTRFYIAQLSRLADAVDRPLGLVIRGALGSLNELRQSFATVIVIDTTIYMKTANRWEAVLDGLGGLSWRPSREQPDVDQDMLLDHNYLSVARALAQSEVRRRMVRQVA